MKSTTTVVDKTVEEFADLLDQIAADMAQILLTLGDPPDAARRMAVAWAVTAVKSQAAYLRMLARSVGRVPVPFAAIVPRGIWLS